MLDDRLIAELKSIAFSEGEKPSDVVSACGLLAKNSIDLDRVISVLNEIALCPVTPSKTKIKAMEMSDKVMIKVADKEPQKVIPSTEEKNIVDSLMKEYGLG